MDNSKNPSGPAYSASNPTEYLLKAVALRAKTGYDLSSCLKAIHLKEGDETLAMLHLTADDWKRGLISGAARTHP